MKLFEKIGFKSEEDFNNFKQTSSLKLYIIFAIIKDNK